LWPSSIAAAAARHSRSIADARPKAPSATGHTSDKVTGSNTPSRIARIFARSRLSITGPRSLSWWHCSGVSSNVLPSGPIVVSSDITSASRIGSIGGLVTCANSWVK
jgi:hypothetical protein